MFLLKLIYDADMHWTYVVWCKKDFVVWWIKVWYIKTYIDCVIIMMSVLGNFVIYPCTRLQLSTHVLDYSHTFMKLSYCCHAYLILLDYSHLLRDEQLMIKWWVMIYKCQMINKSTRRLWMLVRGVCIYEDTVVMYPHRYLTGVTYLGWAFL